MNCSVCGQKGLARGLCRKHYAALPEQKEYKKKYRQSDVYKESQKKYYQSDAYKEHQKKRSEEWWTHAVDDFFKTYKHNQKWRNEGLEPMAQLYSKTLCELSNQQQCKIEEKIVLAGKIGAYQTLVSKKEAKK